MNSELANLLRGCCYSDAQIRAITEAANESLVSNLLKQQDMIRVRQLVSDHLAGNKASIDVEEPPEETPIL